MKKYIFIALAGIGLISCNNTPDAKSIQEEITEHKMEIVELENTIRDLEKQLSDMGKSHEKGSILVSTKEVQPQRFNHYLDITGNVETKLDAYISPEINGLIEYIYSQEGDFVEKGQLMAQIDTDMIERNIDEVNTQLELARMIYSKQKELWDQKIGSEVQYLQAKTNKESLEERLKALKTQLKKAKITAPFNGYVEKVFQKVGEIGNPARQLFHLVNLKSLKVSANISESHLPNIHKGDTANISFAIYPDLKMRLPISVVGSVINPANRTFEIQIEIPNKDKLLKPNLIATVQIRDHAYDSVMVVPSIIVKNDANNNNYVYVVNEVDGKMFAKKTYIKTGQSYGNETMVLEGLNDSDRLIVQGYNLVKNGSAIRIK